MRYYSTNNKNSRVSFKEALLTGLAKDGGLYMPEKIPEISCKFLNTISRLSFQEIALEVSGKFLEKDIPKNELKNIVNQSLNFPVPLIQIADDIHVLELFHGPTLAFKDFAARFMARLMSFYIKNLDKDITVLVATSGDTGSAVANGFFNVEGIKVIILYPSKKVSNIQEAQLTTVGGNVTALEIKGTFDDCQKMVKQAFIDNDINKRMHLTSSNSINIGRLIPQMFYYFYAYSLLKIKNSKVVFSVPSGNFGNLTGGLLAKFMGLPVNKFIASTNINDTVPKYFKTGLFKPKKSKETISNAMDVGNPSNFSRILDLYQSNYKRFCKDISSFSFKDDKTREAIKEVFEKYKYVMDPHGAIAYLGLRRFMKINNKGITGIFLESAHPSKFKETVEKVIGREIEIPDNLSFAMKKEKKSVLLSGSYPEFKDFLMHLKRN